MDRSFIELNRASTDRMRTIAANLKDEDLLVPVGEHWNVALVFAHLAFLDSRALYVLDATEKAGKVVNPEFNIFVNDVLLPLFKLIPGREAVRIAIETADSLDKRLESYPQNLLDEINSEYKRYIFRTYHRTEHLDEAETALKNKIN